MTAYLPILIQDAWIVKLIEWRLPFIVTAELFGAQWCIWLERDA